MTSKMHRHVNNLQMSHFRKLSKKYKMYRLGNQAFTVINQIRSDLTGFNRIKIDYSSWFWIIFGPEKCLKKFSITCWIWNKIAIWHVIWTKSTISEGKSLHLSSKFLITCQIAILIHFQMVWNRNFGSF